MAEHDFTEEYKGLWQSALGRKIINDLHELHDSKVTEAEKANTSDSGYGLLKEASGVMLSISHLKGKGASVVPKARRNGEVTNE